MRLLAALVAFLLVPTAAFAQTADVSIGQRIASVISTTSGPVIIMITLGCTLLGLFLFFTGIVRLVDMSNNQRREGVSSVFVTLVAAACLMTLPEAAGIGMTSIAGGQSFFGSTNLSEIATQIDDPNAGGAQASSISGRMGSLATFQPPENCMNQQDAVPCMAGNLAKNVVPVGVLGAFVFAFICGLWIFAGCLLSVSRSVAAGQGVPQGVAGKFVGSIFLLNAPLIFGIVSSTVFGYGQTSISSLDGTLDANSQMLAYGTGTSSAALQKYEELIGYVFIILALFGVVAFIRGVMIVMAASEGRREAGIGAGTVYVLAGVLLANSKVTTCYILATMGVASAGGIGFCG